MSKTIILTSFRDAPNLDCEKFSIARWQPAGCNYPELRRLAPYYADGKPIKNIPADEYRVAYEMSVLLQDTATAELASVVGSMKADETMAMLCWCNLSRQKAHQKLMCHRILVGYWIEEHAPDVVVVYRDGAENPVWERR